MYKETKIYSCDLCQHEIPEKPFPSLSIPLTSEDKATIRREIEARADTLKRTAPPILQAMLGLPTYAVPQHYTLFFCRPCLAQLFGSLLENLKASCLENVLEELKQKRIAEMEDD